MINTSVKSVAAPSPCHRKYVDDALATLYVLFILLNSATVLPTVLRPRLAGARGTGGGVLPTVSSSKMVVLTDSWS